MERLILWILFPLIILNRTAEILVERLFKLFG
jgi:hypothetical protein